MLDFKNIVNELWREVLIMGLPEEKRYKVLTHPSHPTACWAWREEPKPGEHKIWIGERSVDLCTKKPADKIYIQSLLLHEIAHSKLTVKDIKAVAKWCKDNKIPFSLFNLFEDARIEHIFRVTYSRNFLWAEYEKPIKNKDLNPTSALFKFIQRENRRVRFPATFKEGERVRCYYERIIACESTYDLMPILLEWIEEFPPENSGGKGSSKKDDSSDPVELGELDIVVTEEQEAAMDADATEIIFYCFDTGDQEVVSQETESTLLTDFTTGEISVPGGQGRITEGFERYIPLAEKLFKDKKGYVNTASPSKRLNRKSLIGASDKLYRKKTVKRSAKRNVNVVVDCSGSMGGNPIANARAFVTILNQLALQGKVEGHLVLTSIEDDTGLTETHRLPVSEEFISGIPANGEGENIAGTVELIKPLLRKADYNFFVTDGEITDSPLNKVQLRREGIYTFGLYVGDFEASRLSRWFDRFIVRDSLEGLLNEMLRKVK